ncbi:MAG: excinuclease ABC subunit UvrC, partial [Pseudomonadota bacterium]
LEANLIKKLQPKYNILLKDDKMYPFIKIDTKHPYPAISKHRGAKKNGKFFGPFASASDVNNSIKILQKIFLLRPCTDNYFANRKRPCLEYQIKRCSAPCVNKISEDDYRELIKQSIDFLNGKTAEIQSFFASKMEYHSSKLEFEKAAEYRDKIRSLTNIQSTQISNISNINNADIIAIYKEGDISCVAIAFFRNNINYGNRNFFFNNIQDSTENDILSSFIGQFYQKHIAPAEIILSHNIDSIDVIAKMLSKLADHNVIITIPKIGDKAKIIQQATKNATQSLHLKLLEQSNQINILKKVATEFNITQEINRIEVYDNSHNQGDYTVGAMIVAGKNGFIKDEYRKFNIKSNIAKSDDYGAMREVINRHFTKLLQISKTPKENIWPDLVIIDGGANHLNVVLDQLNSLNITDQKVIAISKGPKRKVGEEYIHLPNKPPYQLDKTSDLAHYIQKLRDEAHRFAISNYRKKHQKDLMKSSLDMIDGIGKTRKKALLNHFGSIKNIEKATINELLIVGGINKNIAENIYNFFHEE